MTGPSHIPFQVGALGDKPQGEHHAMMLVVASGAVNRVWREDGAAASSAHANRGDDATRRAIFG